MKEGDICYFVDDLEVYECEVQEVTEDYVQIETVTSPYMCNTVDSENIKGSLFIRKREALYVLKKRLLKKASEVSVERSRIGNIE